MPDFAEGGGGERGNPPGFSQKLGQVLSASDQCGGCLGELQVILPCPPFPAPLTRRGFRPMRMKFQRQPRIYVFPPFLISGFQLILEPFGIFPGCSPDKGRGSIPVA